MVSILAIVLEYRVYPRSRGRLFYILSLYPTRIHIYIRELIFLYSSHIFVAALLYVIIRALVVHVGLLSSGKILLSSFHLVVLMIATLKPKSIP